jgi:iron(III) transport system ATP-binding protein
LDAKLRESMRFEIKEIQKQLGITVVYVTHDQTEAMAMSDRIFLINRGVVQQCGTPEEIYNQPANQFVADFLGKVDFFKGEASNGRITLAGMNGQTIPYDGNRTGKVDVAVRPENLYFSETGDLEGVLESQYYLGDVDDCRVRVGDILVRVIANGYEYKSLKNGQQVRLAVRDMMVFEDDGTLEQMLKIQT